ncbi:MAG: GNAT family N-acetyltransferase [Elusimicrobiota bacterium]|jgi:ribosomal protein S18 acetylase RimI-like enzyme|nr:GNAT family N-acetyltransferase [Elusimicrobiota bacterium]
MSSKKSFVKRLKVNNMKFELLFEGIDLNSIQISKMSAYTAKKINKKYNFQFDPVQLLQGENLYVAKTNNIILGFIDVDFNPKNIEINKKNIKVTSINFLETNPNYYRQGIASKLVDFVINKNTNDAIIVKPYEEYLGLYTKKNFKPTIIKNHDKGMYIRFPS